MPKRRRVALKSYNDSDEVVDKPARLNHSSLLPKLVSLPKHQIPTPRFLSQIPKRSRRKSPI
jgi:hypothetical protein